MGYGLVEGSRAGLEEDQQVTLCSLDTALHRALAGLRP